MDSDMGSQDQEAIAKCLEDTSWIPGWMLAMILCLFVLPSLAICVLDGSLLLRWRRDMRELVSQVGKLTRTGSSTVFVSVRATFERTHTSGLGALFTTKTEDSTVELEAAPRV